MINTGIAHRAAMNSLRIAHNNQFVGRLHGQHFEHYSIHQAENGRVCANAKGQSHNRYRGKGRTLAHHAEGVLKVLK